MGSVNYFIIIIILSLLVCRHTLLKIFSVCDTLAFIPILWRWREYLRVKKKKRQNIFKNSSELCLSRHNAPVTLDNGQTSLSTDGIGTTSRVSVKTADRVTGTMSLEREFFKWNCSALSKSHTPLSVGMKADISQGKTWKPSYIKLWEKIWFKCL